MKPVPLDIRACPLSEVERLCAAHHAYGGAGGTAVYCFGVYEASSLPTMAAHGVSGRSNRGRVLMAAAPTRSCAKYLQ